jgi:myo-inositol 2-dehydrogenase/D-chiro-inositol 1-dehydrogenase
MVTAGTPAQLTMAHWTSAGVARPTRRADTELFPDAYAGELAAFCQAVRSGRPPAVTGEDARAALRIALACVESVERGGTVPVRDTDREPSA